MIEIDGNATFEEIAEEKKVSRPRDVERPKKTSAKTYNVGNALVVITYGENGVPTIYDVVIHPMDAGMAREAAVVSRLLSKLFDFMPYQDVVEFLRSLGDPFYADVAEALQDFLADFGLAERPETFEGIQATILQFSLEAKGPEKREWDPNDPNLKVCPVCGEKALKVENGCEVCLACGYSRCD